MVGLLPCISWCWHRLRRFTTIDPQTSDPLFSLLSYGQMNREQTSQCILSEPIPGDLFPPSTSEWPNLSSQVARITYPRLFTTTDPQTLLPLSRFSIGTPNREQTNQFCLSGPILGNLFPPTSELPILSSQIASITSLPTSSFNRPRRLECPACSAVFSQPHGRKRHIIDIHLPHSLHCPQCSWTGSRTYAFWSHWRNHHPYFGYTPGPGEFEIYYTQGFVDQIIAGTTTVDIAAAEALEQVRAKADQLQKPSLLTNSMGKKLRAGSSSEGSPLVTDSEPDKQSLIEHDQNDQTMHPPDE